VAESWFDRTEVSGLGFKFLRGYDESSAFERLGMNLLDGLEGRFMFT